MLRHVAPAGPVGGRFLAFDTSTDRMSVALSDGMRVWQHEGPGAAQSSATLIPVILQLLDGAGLALRDLDAIAFGRGPGSFTGLRTACAVAQGLALGAGVPVLPVDTLMVVAEQARWQHSASAPWPETPQDVPLQVSALLDARMNEMYVQHYVFAAGTCRSLGPCMLLRPEQLTLAAVSGASGLLAGNALEVYAARLPALPAGWQQLHVLPSAAALLRLAPALLASGQAVDAARALPLYVRDKVAFTTEERRLAKAAASGSALPLQ